MRFVDNARTSKWEYIVEALRCAQKAGDVVPAGLKKCARTMHAVGDDEQVSDLADLEVVPPGLDRQADSRLVWVGAIDLWWSDEQVFGWLSECSNGHVALGGKGGSWHAFFLLKGEGEGFFQIAWWGSILPDCCDVVEVGVPLGSNEMAHWHESNSVLSNVFIVTFVGRA